MDNKIEVRKKNGEKGIFAKGNIRKGEIILEFEKNFIKTRTRTTIQIDEKLHQESTDLEAEENFINHSCNPNAYINFFDLTLVALKNIKKGEEITFNYLTTEYELAYSFLCNCKSRNCYKYIKGFKYLTLEQKIKLKQYLSPFLKKKLEEELEKSNILL